MSSFVLPKDFRMYFWTHPVFPNGFGECSADSEWMDVDDAGHPLVSGQSCLMDSPAARLFT